RLLAGMIAVACILAIYYFGLRVLRSRAAALIGALLFLTTPMFISNGAKFQLDPSLMLGITLSFCGYLASSLPLTVVGTVIGVWVKGPLGFLVYPSALLFLLLRRTGDRKEWKKFLLYSVVGVTAGAMIWVIIGVFGSWN